VSSQLKVARNARAAELRRRMNELLKDENWKRRNLKHCPKCLRVIEKLSGCDMMVCGTDAHGGNRQNGCGHSFRWSQAAPYTGTNTKHLDDITIDDVSLRSDGTRHGAYHCDRCNNEVVGLRFACVNCPCYNLCEKCEPNSDHNIEHIFHIIGAPDF
jgi:hypothetical protein